MGNLIERANDALIMQKDAMRQQSARIDELSGKVRRQSSTIRKMAPKADYCDRVLAAPDTYCIMTIAIYHILSDGEVFKDLGSNYYNQFNKERKANSMLKKLKALGYEVTIATVAATV